MKPSFARVFSRIVLAAVALIATGAAAGTTSAQETLIASMTPQSSIQFLQEFPEFDNFAPHGTSGVAFKHGKFTIILAVHTEPAGWTMLTSFPDSVPFEKLNDWNRDMRYAKAYRNANGGTTLEFDIDFAGGVTRAHLQEWVKTYVVQLDQFAERLGRP